MPSKSHSIRVDDEIYTLIRKHARPLADTPNSVLRRLLRLDTANPPTKPKKGSRK